VSFPTTGQIYQEPLDRIKGTLGRVSLDTFYQVTFSFGKLATWFGSPSTIPGSSLNDGLTVQQKMSLMCTEAELPGTAYNATSAIGHYQGIQESFATLRDYPPLNLTFYVDADHVMIEVFEKWMNYINPSVTSERSSNSFKRLRYPNSYKEIIHITKYERDSFKKKTSFIPTNNTKSSQLHYEFINVWPTNMSSMKVNYGQSNVLKLSVQLAYDRFFTSYTANQVLSSPGSSSDDRNRSPKVTPLPEGSTKDLPPTPLDNKLKDENLAIWALSNQGMINNKNRAPVNIDSQNKILSDAIAQYPAGSKQRQALLDKARREYNYTGSFSPN
jgi:hypothetical protein|tara:strand:- start:191 stop:1177 length:987 start_codon:yes stop_codon:yes gene_type:complete